MVKEILLTQGKVALVDNEDYDRLMQWKWWALHDRGGNWYAQARINGKRTRMHRFIMGAQKGQMLDHINGNGLDNRECNLRLCTNSQNQHNQKMRRKEASSIYKGISWYRNLEKWKAQITYNRKHMHLGYFSNEIEAARVYDKRAVELFGEFAKTNFPVRIARCANL